MRPNTHHHTFRIPLLLATLGIAASSQALEIEEAEYQRDKLQIEGEKAAARSNVSLLDADSGALLGSTTADRKGKFELKLEHLSQIPCRVEARAAGASADRRVKNAPANCGVSSAPSASDSDSRQSQASTFKLETKWESGDQILVVKGEDGPARSSVTLSDADSGAQIARFDSDREGKFSQKLSGISPVPCRIQVESAGTQTLDDVRNAPSDCGGSVTPPPPPPPVASGDSINSTSQSGIPGAPVSEQPVPGTPGAGDGGYVTLAINDLGMHCGDLDTRISSILPPFNILHATVIRRAGEPELLTESDGIQVYYSAASNPNDPALSGLGPSGHALLNSLDPATGSVYKTNFWDIARQAYAPFYPPGILAAFYPAGTDIRDLGLPVPDVERLYLGDGSLAADQQSMPGRHGPYIENANEKFEQFVGDMPFFLNFDFGYVAQNVNWFEAAGAPLSAFDDAGLENPYPLMRVQAKNAAGQVLASVDTVMPISGEANCQGCHAAAEDGGNGAAVGRLGDNVANAFADDDEYGAVPLEVSVEYAADINILRLHDLKHATDLENNAPVVCQSCHYTPALDLAQVGPRGPENDIQGEPGNPSNGRDQLKHKSMSNVMHSHHGGLSAADGGKLFPDMPPAIAYDSSGGYTLRDPALTADTLEATCYQCHPGRRTNCLRGAMSNGGMVCQDCHGGMLQVGQDFSAAVSPDNPGAFTLAHDFYTNAATPRVPWANEPGCGSCHTGDALDNLHAGGNTLGAPDGIRLLQAFRTDDAKATPIVPVNKRFAETAVTLQPSPTDTPQSNPMLYRVSTGHGGVFCEACHGPTHAIWPNANPFANDNQTAKQLQGHSGTIIECATCHSGDLGNTLDGPHGMHPVGDVRFVNGGHEDMLEHGEVGLNACAACHGAQGQGSVLSVAKAERNGLEEIGRIAKGTQVGCGQCHDNPFTESNND